MNTAFFSQGTGFEWISAPLRRQSDTLGAFFGRAVPSPVLVSRRLPAQWLQRRQWQLTFFDRESNNNKIEDSAAHKKHRQIQVKLFLRNNNGCHGSQTILIRARMYFLKSGWIPKNRRRCPSNHLRILCHHFFFPSWLPSLQASFLCRMHTAKKKSSPSR